MTITIFDLVMIGLLVWAVVSTVKAKQEDASLVEEDERWLVQVSSATSSNGVMLYAHEVGTDQFIYQSLDPKDLLDTVTEKAKQAKAKRVDIVGVDIEASQVIKQYLEKIDV